MVACCAPLTRRLSYRRGFHRFDRFEADPTSPAALHKYLYSAANPVNLLDPSGNSFTAAEIISTAGNMINTGIRVINAVHKAYTFAMKAKRVFDLFGEAREFFRAFAHGLAAFKAGGIEAAFAAVFMDLAGGALPMGNLSESLGDMVKAFDSIGPGWDDMIDKLEKKIPEMLVELGQPQHAPSLAATLAQELLEGGDIIPAIYLPTAPTKSQSAKSTMLTFGKKATEVGIGFGGQGGRMIGFGFVYRKKGEKDVRTLQQVIRVDYWDFVNKKLGLHYHLYGDKNPQGPSGVTAGAHPPNRDIWP
jgi:hypothetical protein